MLFITNALPLLHKYKYPNPQPLMRIENALILGTGNCLNLIALAIAHLSARCFASFSTDVPTVSKFG